MAGVDEPEVVAEVDFGQPAKIVDRLVQVVAPAVEVDVCRGPSRRHSGEHPGAALEHPLGFRPL